MSALIIHHSGKNGGQRGTSRHEDVLDTVLSLRRPDNYLPSQGARFEIRYEKGRGIFGNDADPFEACLQVIDGKSVWTTADLNDPLLEPAGKLYGEGKSVRQVATILNIPKSTAGRLRRKITGQDVGDEDAPGVDDGDV